MNVGRLGHTQVVSAPLSPPPPIDMSNASLLDSICSSTPRHENKDQSADAGSMSSSVGQMSRPVTRSANVSSDDLEKLRILMFARIDSTVKGSSESILHEVSVLFNQKINALSSRQDLFEKKTIASLQ